MTFETQYLAAVSLLTAILLGNSFGLCFGRQAQLVQEMGEEALALELLLQELFIEIPEPHLRWRVIKHIRCARRAPHPACGITTPYLLLDPFALLYVPVYVYVCGQQSMCAMTVRCSLPAHLRARHPSGARLTQSYLPQAQIARCPRCMCCARCGLVCRQAVVCIRCVSGC